MQRLSVRCGPTRLRTFAAALAVLLQASAAGAHDTKTDGDPSNDWLEGIRNGSGALCCGNNDCRPIATSAGRLPITLSPVTW